MLAVYVFQFPEFLNEVKLGQDFLAKEMEGLNPRLQNHMELAQPFQGQTKLNMFTLVPKDLYDIIKGQSWGNGGGSWQGFRGGPGNVAYGIMSYHSPAVNLPGGRSEEVGGYEKQPNDKYFDAKEPSLNLEFKWNSGDTEMIDTRSKGKVAVPKVSYILNVHVKQVPQALDQGKLYKYS